jgi:2,4-dienoyl-CoA reductase (NADPH2)
LGGLTCLARMFSHLPYLCTVNPKLGHENDPAYQITPAPLPKKVLVAGGGPGGIEYALASAQRGHKVTPYEKSDRFGGQLHMAAKEVSTGNTRLDLVRYYELTLAEADVEILLETELTPRQVRTQKPDAVIIATGCRVDTPIVSDFDRWVNYFTVDDILRAEKDPGKDVIVIGGNRAGLVTAEYLALNGKRMTLLEDSKRVAGDVTTNFKWRHKVWLDEYDIDAKTSVKIEAFEKEGVRFTDDKGTQQFLKADGIVLASPRLSNNDLLNELTDLVDELYVIGDAAMPRHLWNAIHEAYRLGPGFKQGGVPLRQENKSLGINKIDHICSKIPITILNNLGRASIQT